MKVDHSQLLHMTKRATRLLTHTYQSGVLEQVA